MNYSVYFI